MIAGLKVISPGLHTTIQDLGRRGYQDVGVPVAGPLDRIALTLANALVGNAANVPALEVLAQGPTLEVTTPSARVALVGGNGGLLLEKNGSRHLPPGQSIRLVQGEHFRVAPLGNCACAYLAAEHGFDIPLCLGSAATYTRGAFGGFHGRVLKAGDLLALCHEEVEARTESAFRQNFDPQIDNPIRVVLGPQADYFEADTIATFLSDTYRVSPHADRMGYRLDGPKLTHSKGHDIVSDGIVAGSVQVPGSGYPIILLADAQTSGGYPKIATVISADAPLVGRRGPGSAIRFTAVERAAAEQARRDQDQQVVQWIAEFRPPEEASSIDLDALYKANLIGGVLDALE
jgi:allophanate hydrolase